MRGVSVIDPRSAPRSTFALEAPAEMTPGDLALTRQWGFASDARAILMICLYAADTIIVAASGIVSHLIRNGSRSIASPYWGHIIVGCQIFGLVMQTAAA